MDGSDNKLIQTLLERLSSKLPNRTFEEIEDLRKDDIVALSQGTLVELSKTHVETVATELVTLIDNITPLESTTLRLRPPPLVLLSQTFLVELLADCLSAHWDSVNEEEFRQNQDQDQDGAKATPRVSPLTARKIRRIEPPPLNEILARHILDLVLRLCPSPVTTDEPAAPPAQPSTTARNGQTSTSSDEPNYVPKVSDLDKAVYSIMEFLSASNWPLVFQTLQRVLKQLRHAGSDEYDANGIQLLAHVWINSKQLSQILSDIYAAFYHIKKPHQQLIAQLLPDTILKWIDTHPQEFINLHLSQRRLEGGADVLFDIVNNMVDSGKKKAIFWPMQTALLLLIPEVFLASMLGETNRNVNAKRVLFLENLKKTLRQRFADIAALCLVTICRAASYFDTNSEIAILSFALDVQNDMKEEIFKRKFDEDTALDRDIMVKAFVSLCHLSKDQVVDNLVPRLLDRASHMSYKVAVFTGAAIIASQDRTNSFVTLYQAISPDVRDFLYTIGNAKRNNPTNNGVNRRTENQSSESLLSTELLHQLLELLKIRPNLLFEGAIKEESSTFFEKTLSCILNCASEDDTLIQKLSTEFARRLISREANTLHSNNTSTKTEAEIQVESWKGASATLVTFSRKLLDYDLSDPTLKVMLGLVRDYMETRLQFLKSMKVLMEAGADVAERQIAGISLEVSFLVLLCSSDLDICSLITSAINILCEEGRLTENMEDLERSGLSVMKNYAVYSELSSPNFRMTGPVAFQKRLRKLLVRMLRPTAGILTAWEAVFTKWKTLCKVVVSGSSGRQSVVDERTLVEWRNYSGFLAALGGCCISPPPQEIRLDDASVAGLRWIDRLAPDGDPYSLLERFMRQCLQLLVCSSLNVREAIREVLGSEMNPRLYVSFFRSLEIELNSVFENNPNAIAQSADGKLLFAEQSTSLLRAIIDRVEDTQESTEFSSLGDSAIGEKYERMIQLLVSNFKFVLALCNSCPTSEIDEIAFALLNIFDSKGLGLTLLKELIEQEVANTESESELLRRNCVATKMLSVFAKWKGATYLRATLQKVLERLIISSDELDLELDPARTSSPEELQRNALQLRFVTNVFIDEICKSVNQVPSSFRYICHTITTSVTTRFPEAKFTAVGAFIFLRFFCPAIVAPDSEGLVKSIPKRGMRRGLLLIAKVVQNLANNVLFGAKEPYMIPLNDFLTANIYRVTSFLRDISSPIPIPDQAAAVEVFDFGSCIALHRFMYDHWEVVRQKLLHPRLTNPSIPNNVAPKYTANDLKAPVAEFSALIPTLGAPPLDFSWTRPQLQATIQPSYYRFQQFMLRNSGRSVEPITSARIVYDGGESKDGMPVICVILRNINAETIDIELLIYCYLKIASRMWSKPFGLLVDATSYTIGNELPDDIPKKLDALSPPEMLANLKRFYVYNMNSAYRKYFRRMVRHAYKDETSGFHPKNLEYTLLGSLGELERHFHLPSLHLPKDTMSLVADSRFVFQPVTRLSKTKGRIDVVIKVGSQYIQITTTKKQDIVPGLRMQAIVNDIFSLSEIEEANASFHTEEENAFGIKTENGKVAMFFSSPKRVDVLQSIKAAKSKSLKDSKPSPLSERVIRPEDVPGTLLNIALMNMGSADQFLRISAYNLLCALCQTFRFKLDRQFVSAKGLSIPADSLNLIVGVSEKLAANEPQLTFDFLTEFFVGWAKSPLHQRPLSILYMAPWLVNLHSQVLALDGDSERGKERLSGIARKLIEITVNETTLYTNFQQNAWSVISRDESLLEVFFDELIKSAINYGFGSAEAEVIGSIAASFGTLTMRGKIIARVRKALNRTSLRPTRHLKDNVIWKEILIEENRSPAETIAAPSVDMANIWRARWMSLVASTAFQNNPAIQPRAFAVMGCLAREDVDDDLLYQVLVALRSALARFVEQGDAEMLVSIITSLTKMANNLPPSSRYLHQMFWLAMSLIRVGPPSLFNCSAGLLQAVLRVIASSDEFKDGKMAVVLMQGRFTVEEAAAAVDDLFGINFEIEYFAYSVCFCIVKGLSDPTTRAATLRTFTTFLEVVTANIPESLKGDVHPSYIPYLSCLVPRAANADDWKDIWLGAATLQKEEAIMNWAQLIPKIMEAGQKELLLCLALAVIDFRMSDESIQTAGLQLFEYTAAHRPDVFILIHDRVIAELEEILVSSQSQTMLKLTHDVIRKISSDKRYSDRQGTQDLLERILESVGFSGIWSSTTFKRTSNDQERMCVDRLIELIIA
ncbi:Neurofibromin [Arthrobotrys entomopaga]|nr:Neurofibromin [Arthrobotrys entomopaga]